jgi:hypothetical protein
MVACRFDRKVTVNVALLGEIMDKLTLIVCCYAFFLHAKRRFLPEMQARKNLKQLKKGHRMIYFV